MVCLQKIKCNIVYITFRHGECVVNDKPKEDEYIAPGQWSDWAYSGCQSGCISNVSF